jgi:hypothetical protein
VLSGYAMGESADKREREREKVKVNSLERLELLESIFIGHMPSFLTARCNVSLLKAPKRRPRLKMPPCPIRPSMQWPFHAMMFPVARPHVYIVASQIRLRESAVHPWLAQSFSPLTQQLVPGKYRSCNMPREAYSHSIWHLALTYETIRPPNQQSNRRDGTYFWAANRRALNHCAKEGGGGE